MKIIDLVLKEPYQVTSAFGYRIHPITRKQQFHTGTDYGTFRKKIPCYAVSDGHVRVNTFCRYAGHYISILQNINGKQYRLVYKHLDQRPNLNVGQTIKKGQLIGYVGMSGHSVTGIHLHFEVIDHITGVHLDPEKFNVQGGKELTYTIKKGDTLFKIAKEFNTTVNELVMLNNIANANSISVGEVLIVKEEEKTDDYSSLLKRLEELEKKVSSNEVNTKNIVDIRIKELINRIMI